MKNIEILIWGDFVTVDEGMALRDGERLNIQCILIDGVKSEENVSHKYHYHKYIEFLYFIKGSSYIFVGEERILCKQGELFIVYSNEPHALEHPEDNSYYVIKFLPELISATEQTTKEFEYAFNFNLNTHSRIVSDESGEIKALFDDAYKRFADNNYSNELFVRGDVIRICGETVNRWYKNGEMIPISRVTGHENLVLIKKVMEYAKETNGGVGTHQAAKMCNMSDGHFSRIFRSVSGMTFMQYIKNVKMEEAERLLKCTDKTVTEISLELNYATTSHFIEDFRTQKGITPKQYKKECII